MKRFSELTPKQQSKAITRCQNELTREIIEGTIHFNDMLNLDDLQARIDAAFIKAEQMQTPWFAHEYIMDTCEEDLTSIASATAEGALYPEAGETCLAGIA